MNELSYRTATDADLQQILAPQRRNLEENLSPGEVAADGFARSGI